MNDEEKKASQTPWNKGKIVGQKAPLKLKDVWAIRIRLHRTAQSDALEGRPSVTQHVAAHMHQVRRAQRLGLNGIALLEG